MKKAAVVLVALVIVMLVVPAAFAPSTIGSKRPSLQPHEPAYHNGKAGYCPRPALRLGLIRVR